MSEEYLRSGEEHSFRGAREQTQHGVEHEERTLDGGVADLTSASLLLSGVTSLSGRGNTPMRAAAMQRVQQTHGNRAVQRFMAANQAVPVQRDDEEDQKPSFSPWLPDLKVPFGGGFGFQGTGKGVGLDYKGGSLSGGLGYEYGGAFSADGGFKSPFGKGSLGLEFDPWKKEGSAGVKFGDFFLKGSAGPKGWGLGLGYGDPLINPGGFPANPADPSKDWRKGEIGPGMFGPPDDIAKQKKGWGFGFGFGQQQQGDDKGAHPDVPAPWWAYGGLGGSF